MKAAASPFHLKPPPRDPEADRLKELLSTLLTPPQYRPPTALGLGTVAFPGGALPSPVLGPNPNAVTPPQAQPPAPAPSVPPVERFTPQPAPDYPAFVPQNIDPAQVQREAASLYPREPYTRQMDALTRQYQQETAETTPQWGWKEALLAIAAARYGAKGLAAVGSGLERGRQTNQARREKQASLLLDQRNQLEKERAKQEAQADLYTQRRILAADQAEARRLSGWEEDKRQWAEGRQKAAESAMQKAVAAYHKDASGYAALKGIELSAPQLSRLASLFRIHADNLSAHNAPEANAAQALAADVEGWARNAPAQSLDEQKTIEQIKALVSRGLLDEVTAAYIAKGVNLRDAQTAREWANRDLTRFKTEVEGPAEVKRIQAQTESIQADLELKQKRIAAFDQEAKDKHDNIRSQIAHRNATKKLAQGRALTPAENKSIEADARIYESEWAYYKKEAARIDDTIFRGHKDTAGQVTPFDPATLQQYQLRKHQLLDKAAKAYKTAKRLRAQIAQNARRGPLPTLGGLPPAPVDLPASMKPGAKPYDPNDRTTWPK